MWDLLLLHSEFFVDNYINARKYFSTFVSSIVITVSSFCVVNLFIDERVRNIPHHFPF